MRARGAAGHTTRVDVDLLVRMTHLWVQKGAAPDALRLRVLYGERYPTPETANLRGRASLVLDGAGLVESARYDFHGQPLTTSRKLAATFTNEPDWTPAAGSGTASLLLGVPSWIRAADPQHQAMAGGRRLLARWSAAHR